MKTKSIVRILCSLMVLLLGATSLLAQTQAGAIKAARVTGAVTKASANGTETPLTENSILIESDSIRTAGGASVVLVFANGSSVHVGENSRLAIEEFKMDPLDETIAVANLTREPSVSKTRLNLSYGEMVGNVKTLNSASSYDVRTPIGAAGIRGTTFRIFLRFDGEGRANFSLATSEGLVNFVASGSVQISGGEQAQVPAGTEVTAVVTVDPNSGAIQSVTIQPTAPISTTAASAIQTAAETAVTTAAQVTITQNDSQTAQQQAQQQQNPPTDQPPANNPPADNPPTNQPTNPPANQNPTNPADRSPGGE